MTTDLLNLQRLANQQLDGSRFKQPQALVRWFAAIQAQDYAMAKWAIGLRLAVSGITDTKIEQAFNDGQILRTHVLRPTWHFVAPTDIRWMLMLSAPRVRAASAYMHRQLGLNASVFKRSNAIIAKALQRGQHLTRSTLQVELSRAKIIAEGPKLAYLLMNAELDGIICSGPREGRQFTYALLDERVPQATQLDRPAALAELARRYFASRGPATVNDFAWWSGLTVNDTRAAAESLGTDFNHEIIDGRDHIFTVKERVAGTKGSSRILFLPQYDEYGIAYKDRTGLFDLSSRNGEAVHPGSAYNQTIVVNGRITGTWRRAEARGAMTIEVMLNVPTTRGLKDEIAAAADRYAAFVKKPARLSYRDAH